MCGYIMYPMRVKVVILWLFAATIAIIPVMAIQCQGFTLASVAGLCPATPSIISVEYKMSNWLVQPTKEQRGYCQTIVNTVQKIDTKHLISSIICNFRGDKYVNITRQCGFAWFGSKQISMVVNSHQCDLPQVMLHEMGHRACFAKGDRTEACANDYWPAGVIRWSGNWNATNQQWKYVII